MKPKWKLKVFIGGVISLLLLLALIWTAYRYDNKYFSSSRSIISLTDNWEYCAGKLYTPEDLRQNQGDIHSELIYIGQFGDFSNYTGRTEPFGEATYRKVMTLKEGGESWMLMIPEIFSASKVYVNGECIAKNGVLPKDSYRMHTQNMLIPLPSGSVELVIQASNYSHYYSGLIYPPILGSTSDIKFAAAMQLAMYGLLCFFSLGIAAASVSLWKHKHTSTLHTAYGLMCLFFAVHVSYPFIHWLGLANGEFFYMLEDSSFYAMILCMVILTGHLTRHIFPPSISRCAAAMASAMIILSILFPYILFGLYHQMTVSYGYLVSLFKLLMSIYLITASLAGIIKAQKSVWLLYGNTMFGMGVLADFITAGKFEPLRFCWIEEYASFIMVIFFTVLILKTNRETAVENERLTNNLQKEVERKTAFLSKLLHERRNFLVSAAHDLKAPASVIQTYVDYIRESQSELDDDLKEYLSVIDRKTSQIQENVQSLQIFNTEDRLQDPPVILDCGEFLSFVYQETLPYTDANGIHYEFHIPESTACMYGQKMRFFRAFENIIINATEHTPLEGDLILNAEYINDSIVIRITDNGNGIAPEHLPHVFDYKFTTSQDCGGRGMGLYFSKITIEEYGGSILAESTPDVQTTFTVTLPVRP